MRSRISASVRSGVLLEVLGDVAGAPALTSSSMPTAEQIWPGRAVAALEAVVVEEGLGDGVQLVVSPRPAAVDDLGAVVGDRQGQAGGGAAAVEQHGARPALAVVAPLLRRGDAEVLAQQIEQGDAVVYSDRRSVPSTRRDMSVKWADSIVAPYPGAGRRNALERLVMHRSGVSNDRYVESVMRT